MNVEEAVQKILETSVRDLDYETLSDVLDEVWWDAYQKGRSDRR